MLKKYFYNFLIRYNLAERNDDAQLFKEFGGHKFYLLEAVPQHSVNRFFHFLGRSEQINNLGVPILYFNAIAQQIDALVNSNSPASKFAPLSGLIKFACQKEDNKWYYLTMAVIESFVLIDDEPLDRMSEKHNDLKRKLMHENPDICFFFTNIATEYLKKLDDTFKDLNLEEYLKSRQVELAMLENITIPKTKEFSN